MKWVLTSLIATVMFAGSASAQPQKLERNIAKQREAVAAWTACIADENTAEVAELLRLDFKTKDYAQKLLALSNKRVSSECFSALPRAYRRIELSGLPFAGGLAERMIERDTTPLIRRLSMAAIGKVAATYSYTDRVASCVTRGAPHLVAQVFATEINSEEEEDALAALVPVKNVCTSQGVPLEASPLAMRSMLATASFRLLEAQEDTDDA